MIRPFANGTEFDIWYGSCCEKCNRQSVCSIENSLWEAYYGDGKIDIPTAEAMNLKEVENFNPFKRPCLFFTPKRNLGDEQLLKECHDLLDKVGKKRLSNKLLRSVREMLSKCLEYKKHP